MPSGIPARTPLYLQAKGKSVFFKIPFLTLTPGPKTRHFYGMVSIKKPNAMKKHIKIPDGELIKKTLEGDPAAMGGLYHRYYPLVFNKCVSMVKDQDEAFDIAQESLLKAFDSLKNFRGDSTFSTWLYTITHRNCLQALRKKNKNTMPVDACLLNNTANEAPVDGPSGLPGTEDIMFDLIDHLPPQEKELLVRKYYKGESIKALQHLYHASSSAIKMRLKRSKEKLNQLYPLAVALA